MTLTKTLDTTTVAADELRPGDVIVHPTFDRPMQVTRRTQDLDDGYVILDGFDLGSEVAVRFTYYPQTDTAVRRVLRTSV